MITSDIAFTVRKDVEREKAANSWRGFRHTFGLKVRGQRTRTTGRKGGAVGVAKSGKVLPVKTEGVAPAEGATADGKKEALAEGATADGKKEALAEGATADGKKEAPAGKKESPTESKQK